MISPDDIKKLANLARIKISPEEEASLAIDMENILGYVKQIQGVTAGAEIDPNLNEDNDSQKNISRNVFRDDTTPHESGIHTEAVLAEAPQREGDYVKVKKIL